MNVWITNEPWPATDDVLVEASTAGADTIWHGIPESHKDEIPIGTVGFWAIPDPAPLTHLPLDPHGQLVTLLVVIGALDIDDAEHVAGPGVTAADLVAEAEAWSLGQ